MERIKIQINYKAVNVTQSFIQDINEAIKDGLTTNEMLAIIGAVSETALRSLPKDKRVESWLAINGIMIDVMGSDW